MLTNRVFSWIRRLCRSTATPVAHQLSLQVEALEERNTPTVSANNLFVASLYQGLLGRPADTGGLTYWSGQLNAGVSRAQVAEGIATSTEGYAHDVTLFYQALLNRAPDSGGLVYWTNMALNGLKLDYVKAGILGSDEFLQETGGSTNGFLQGLYVEELGRSVDSGGLAYWNTLLSEGYSRTGVAALLLNSPEASMVKTTSFYLDTLGRAPDVGGLNYWSSQLQANVSETQVLAGLLGSDEYFARVQQYANTALTDANTAATQMITTANLFTGPLPNAEYLALQFAPKPPPFTPPSNNAATGDNNSGTGNVGGNTGSHTTITTNTSTTNTSTTSYNYSSGTVYDSSDCTTDGSNTSTDDSCSTDDTSDDSGDYCDPGTDDTSYDSSSDDSSTDGGDDGSDF